MKKLIVKKSIIITIGILIILLLTANTSALTKIKNISTENMIYVDDDNKEGPWDGTINYPYQNIQDALDFAENDFIIHIYEGKYFSSGSDEIEITKSVKLVGENRENTIITLDKGLDHVLKLSSDNVTLINLTIDDAIYGIKGEGNFFSIKNCIISNNLDGINLVSSSNVSIYNCKIIDNADGICLERCQNCNISNNHIISNFKGIRISKSSDNSEIYNNKIEKNLEDGISITESDNNFVIGNRFYINSQGIFGEALYFYRSSNNIISKNSIYKNECGGIVFTTSCKNNKILKNTIEDNIHNSDGNYFYGISFFEGSDDNLIYHNSFIDNNHLGLSNNAVDYCKNKWHNDSIKEGNYWSDYNGLDKNNDDVGDKPYNIRGGNNQDLYPLKEPYVRKSKEKSKNIIYINFFEIILQNIENLRNIFN